MEGEGWMEGVGWWVAERKPGRKGLAGWSGWMEGSGLGGGWKAVGAGWREVDGGRLEGGMDGVKCGSVRAVRFCVSVQRFAVFCGSQGWTVPGVSVPVCGSIRGLPEFGNRIKAK